MPDALDRRREVVTTCTRDCPGCCGLIATVESGRGGDDAGQGAVPSPSIFLRGNPDHPLTKGTTCRKAKRYPRRAASPERVLHPLRKRGQGWKRVSWDEALDELAARLAEAAAEHGPESILYYQGFGERTALQILNSRFFNLLGGVTTLRGTLCGGTGQAAQDLDFGRRVSHDPLDHLNSRTIVLWGRNPAATQPPLVQILTEARRKAGTAIIVVDPVATESVGLADHHIQPRPGGDSFLSLAAARIALDAGWADEPFLADHTEGFDGYHRLLHRHSLDELLRAADVHESEARLLAEALARSRPASILLGWGLHRWEGGHLAVRAIDGLAAVTGNLGVAGGGVSQGFDEYGPFDHSLSGHDLISSGPFSSSGPSEKSRRTFLTPRIGREILDATDPPVRVVVVTAANPVCMAPDSARVAEAFRKTGFVAVAGHFLDDTADCADLFLPCATFLEEDDIVAGYGHNYVGPVNKVMDPPGECRSQFDIFSDLARRFPFGPVFSLDAEAWLRRLVKPLTDQGVPFEDIRRGPVRIPDAPMVPYADKISPTPSGRFRFLAEFDLDPTRRPDPAYPYHLLSVGSPEHLNSELTMGEHDPLPWVRLNTLEGKKLGLEDGDEAVLATRLGEMRVRVKLDPRERRDTMVCRRGGWIKAGHGVNRLIPDVVSRVGEGTAYYEATASVRKAG